MGVQQNTRHILSCTPRQDHSHDGSGPQVCPTVLHPHAGAFQFSDRWDAGRGAALSAAAARTTITKEDGLLGCRLLEHRFDNGGTELVGLVDGYHRAGRVGLKPGLCCLG